MHWKWNVRTCGIANYSSPPTHPANVKSFLLHAKQIGEYRRAKGIELEIVPHTRITLEKTAGRGGLLTMPGILAMNRGPVQRGTWILERILGVHLPDPPPDVEAPAH